MKKAIEATFNKRNSLKDLANISEIIENLEARFGELENKETLDYAIISSAKNAAEDNIKDYLHSLIQNKRDSFTSKRAWNG